MVAEAVVLVFLLAATLTTQARKSGGTIQRLEELWRGLLPAALSGDRVAVDRIRTSLVTNSGWRAFHRLVDEQTRASGRQASSGLRRLCRSVGLVERLQLELLGAHDRLDRAAAGRTLARLRENIAPETVSDLLDSEDPAVVLAAAHATASFRDPRQLLRVFRAVYDRTPITLHGAAELLSTFGEDSCVVIHQFLKGITRQYLEEEMGDPVHEVDPKTEVDRNDTAAQVVLIDLLGFYGYRPAGLTLLRLLGQSKDEEVLIHLVKAIASVGEAAAVPALTSLRGHQNWVVRSQSALALATLRAPQPSLQLAPAAAEEVAVAVA